VTYVLGAEHPFLGAGMSLVERRRNARQKCFNRELIADDDGTASPARSDFYWVTLQNISAAGITFLSSRKPAKNKLVVVLGNGPICVARIVRTRCKAEAPESLFEVGCEFERRLG